MRCPHCGDQTFEGRCPRCGSQTGSAQEPIRFDFSSRQAAADDSKRGHWRSELKRRLDEHYGRNQKPDEDSRTKNKPGTSTQTAGESAAERPLFDYRLAEPREGESRRKIVRLAKQGRTAAPVAEKPLIRAPVKPRRNSEIRSPRQRRLTLQVAEVGAENPPAIQTEEADEGQKGVSREIIFSRLLAGIIDLSLPLVLATLFTLTASTILNFDLLSSSSIQAGVTFSLCFYFLNSFFFLALSGQTPGMYLTDLQLIGEDSTELTARSLFLRITLFLPVSATVVGLLWGIFDPWCRCLHDRLSGTRVVPVDTGSITDMRNIRECQLSADTRSASISFKNW